MLYRLQHPWMKFRTYYWVTFIVQVFLRVSLFLFQFPFVFPYRLRSSAEILVLDAQPTQWITGSAFRISLQPDWVLPVLRQTKQRSFLTGQSWRVLKSGYTVGSPEKGFRRRFADGVNQSLISSAHRLSRSQSPRYVCPAERKGKRSIESQVQWTPAQSRTDLSGQSILQEPQ